MPMKKVDFTLKPIARRYSKSGWARAIIRVLPFGASLHEYLITVGTAGQPNTIKCELGISRIITDLTDPKDPELNEFRIWDRADRIRDVIFQVLSFYEMHRGCTGAPSNISHDHADETGYHVLTDGEVSALIRLFFRGGFLWEDPHNCRKYLTPDGKELLLYFRQRI